MPTKAPSHSPESVIDWQSRLRGAFMAELTEADVRQIVRAQIDAAKAGNQGAARLVLAYGVGSPAAEPPAPPPPPRPKVIDVGPPPEPPERFPSARAHDDAHRESKIAALANRVEKEAELFPSANGVHRR